MFTLVLITIHAFTTWMGFNHPTFRDQVRFSTYAIKGRAEFYRVATSSLVHASWMEFFWLAIGLLIFGGNIESAGGPFALFMIFEWGIVGGNLIASRLNREDLFFSNFGMGAGVNAVVFAFVMISPWSYIITFPIPLPLPAWLYALLFLGMSTFGFRSCCDPARRDATLAGTAAGLVVAALIFRDRVAANPLWFVILLSCTLLCLWLVRINRAGLPWGSVLRAQFSRSPRPRTPAKPSRKPSKPPPEDIDALLDKISASGIQSLTDGEREKLKAYSEKKRR